MRRYHHSHRMQSSWPGIQSGIWLIGLAILFFTGLWWPGILVLVGISMVLQWVFSKPSPQTFEPIQPPAPQRPAAQSPATAPAPSPVPAPAAPVPATQATPYHPMAALPPTCPRCGGPVRAHEVKWTGRSSATCAYCGSNLPLKKESTL